MRLTTCFRLAALATLSGLVCFSLPAQDQSSGDVAAAARNTREQQKNAPKPKKVVTNDDIPSVNTNTPAPEASAPGSDATAPKAEGKPDKAPAAAVKPEDDPKSEAYWRKRFKETNAKLDQAQKELDILQRELEKDQVQYYPDPQKALTQQYSRADINEKTAKIDAKKKEVDALKQQLSDMEDEVRRAGGDPGWAR
jgi:hypothetical protein